MPLMGALLNHQEQLERLNVLRQKLLKVAADAPETPKPPMRLRCGAVQVAAIKVLTAAQRPMEVQEIHASVERLLSMRVPKSSVNSCLSTRSKGKKPLFKRLGQGRYALIP
ncbi:MAG: HTH domain-containing protein [Solirubrobacterales bacterium]